MNVAARAIDKLVNPPRMSDPDRLRAAVSGKTVLVTGASYGLGNATAIKLAAAGARVLLVARSEDELNALAASITARGDHAIAIPADSLTKPPSPHLRNELSRRTGRRTSW